MSRFFPLLFLFLSVAQAAPTDPVKIHIHTSYGEITLELYPDKAPQTVANFLRYVDSGFYANTIFHRVIRDFMIQGGGHDLNYQQKPTLGRIPNEAANGLKNKRGTIAMARSSDPHSATTQFFINLVDNPYLDFTAKDLRGWGYCVFGRVVAGMDVVDKIGTAPTGPAGPFVGDVPQGSIVIERIVRAEKIKQVPEKPAAQPATTTKEKS
ncbi:MAG TPA: peptidylprolyl isomerase [Gammaproteobacteria bacterium]